MKITFNHIVIKLLAVTLCVACSQKPTSYNTNEYTILQDSIKKWLDTDKLIGAELLVIENEEFVFHKASGLIRMLESN
jgi:hypothetical protein